MSDVKTSFIVKDRASDTIRKINKRFAETVYTLERCNKALGQLNGSLNASYGAEIERFSNSAADSANQLERGAKGADNLKKKMGEAERSAQNFLSTLTGIAATIVSIQGLKQLVNTTDEMALAQARLQNIADDSASGVSDAIFVSSQRARSNYLDTAKQVSKLMTNARNAFKDSDEAIAFVETFNKMGALGGASVYESSQAMYQLTQSMAKGRLDGDELRSVMEGMPLVAKAIADYLGTDVGTMKEMARQGEVTAQVVKEALQNVSSGIDEDFANLPMTFAQGWTKFSNTVVRALNPLQQAFSRLWNSEGMQSFAESALYVLGVIINLLALVVNGVSAVMDFLAPAADILGIVAVAVLAVAAAWGIYTVVTKAAAIAQGIFNAVLMANPIMMVITAIILLIAAIFAIAQAVANVTGLTESALGLIAAIVLSVGAYIVNFVVLVVSEIFDVVFGVINALLNVFATFANFVGNVFNDPVAAVIHLFEGLGQTVLKILGGIASALDKIFGSNLSSAVQGWSDSLSVKATQLAAEYGNGTYTEQINFDDVANPLANWQGIDYGEAWRTGAEWGDGVSSKIKSALTGGALNPQNYDLGLENVAANVDDIAGDTGSMKNALDISEENLEYLRDIAERDAINKFTTASVRVEMVNNNNVATDADLDGIIDGLATRTEDALMRIAEGV